MRKFPILFITLFLLLNSIYEAKSQKLTNAASQPEKISLCELTANPAAYNHKLIEVKGFVSLGFENFTLFDPTCASQKSIWLEYGGKIASGATYCCGNSANRRRKKPLVVEKIAVPLVEDELFRAFDQHLHRSDSSMSYAAIVGRFFSGKKNDSEKPELFEGYGHFGAYSLLAIQQVISADTEIKPNLNYGTTYNYDEKDNTCNSFRNIADSEQDLIKIQQSAEADPTETNFNNPQRVALQALANALKTDEKMIKPEQIHQSQELIAYLWNPDFSKDKKYLVTLSRPYWLSFYAKDAKRVAWTVDAIQEISCSQNE